MSLFKRLITPDRQQTQLAYRIKYWPFSELSGAAKEIIPYHKRAVLTKRVLLERCSEDKNTLYNLHNKPYTIVWAYNNTPTQEEWNKSDGSRLITVEYRCSPAIDCFAVAILSYGLPSERLIAHKQGEFS